ncbi:MAG TPA: GAF domain-containing protein [Polyangiaceae bacterium]|nr:GAF domain-containing protein [Polyangiaceae bacterium]
MVAPHDPFVQHLAMLLSVAELEAKLRPAEGAGDAVGRALELARLASGSGRVSLFEVEGFRADDEAPLTVTRVGRAGAGDDGVEPRASFYSAHSALLLSSLGAGVTEALGPVDPSERFYREHLPFEPAPPLFVAFVPIYVGARPYGVLEAARAEAPGFDGASIDALEGAASVLGALLGGARREETIAALLRELLPELLDPRRAPTSLPERLRQWLEQRPLEPDERQAFGLAATIADLSARSPDAIGLAGSILSSVRRALARSAPREGV